MRGQRLKRRQNEVLGEARAREAKVGLGGPVEGRRRLAGRLDSRTALAAPKRCDELDATKYVCGSWYTSIGEGVEIATGSPEPENRDFLQLCELRPGSNRCFGVWLLCEGGAPSADSDDGWF